MLAPMILIVAVIVAVIGIVVLLWLRGSECGSHLKRFADGSLLLEPGGLRFRDMNEFQQYWARSGKREACPLPILEGAVREVAVMDEESEREETYAKTPINKLDDYEFSRIFGYERNGKMILPRQNYNILLEDRQFDWADLPLSAGQREGRYRGLQEGFSAEGDLMREAVARYGETDSEEAKHEKACKETREDKEVAALIAKAYADEPAWEPVYVRTGPNNWEVTELKPRARYGKIDAAAAVAENNRVINEENTAVDMQFRYDTRADVQAAIDPWFTGLEAARAMGDLPSIADQDGFVQRPVPGLERSMAPTFDHKKWY